MQVVFLASFEKVVVLLNFIVVNVDEVATIAIGQ
jgi:hypothetical protein